MAAEENTGTTFDPIEESRRQWLAHGWDGAADGMTTVISVMRIHQLFLARVDAALKPFALTFSRYEVLTLLSFTRAGTLPMSKISARLQVHATSTTNSVDRLEKAGLVARRSHPDDRRTTLVDLTDAGRELAAQATMALNAEVFTSPDFNGIDLDSLLPHLEKLRSGLEAGN
ncbi:MAG: MarR family winged helix-turn-helix transcriptional regulator [Brevibacterium sp.]|uniref:DNA-binding transcriptional regulator, MarR family n=2 Tax=Brevibacterium linens TaxID=1703 RepID=A0A2H1JND9_BRELN|nr:MarR family transcriptional regulator [Brevibacterium linens]AZU00242.1 MarR family transcriptional regulator [Brevibacterium linens]KAB1942334.1 MarR family transcriptional regulator [Brevibacterium linens ATCC 9172]SMX88997.1 DNA-binding transcriptional regulator, MarR family [Brevibacterium linens]SMY02251.1 DNA-binding transcriptional regulator, MarR family [Brevibacterium linens ATCC 9172]